jgi:putative membrane protein
MAAFHAGTLVGLMALTSPLDALGDEYLFSAHMVQHLMLVFIVAPLWLLGTPGWMIDQLVPQGLRSIANRLLSPIVAFSIFVVVMWGWHLPGVYQLTLESEAVHIFEHLSFIGAGLIGWWPVLGAADAPLAKPEPSLRMLYLFLLAIPCTGLAAVLTFSTHPFYPFYESAQHIFGLSALEDQHLGGLVMWLPTHLILLTMLGVTFTRWFGRSASPGPSVAE